LNPLGRHHDMLLANVFAQTQALAFPVVLPVRTTVRQGRSSSAAGRAGRLLVENLAGQGGQRLERFLGEPFGQLATVRSMGTRARPQRRAISGSWARSQVLKAPGAHGEQRDHGKHQPAGSVVAPEPGAAERAADPAMQSEQAEVLAQ
jgi:hypothetical protein